MRRHRLGAWRCPSGNGVDAYILSDDGSGVRQLALEWDEPPPLRAVDQIYYLAVILPALTKAAQAYLEKPGPALIVAL